MLILAILAGSSDLDIGLAGKSAPLYWVELWALVAYPLYIVAVARGRVPRLGTLYLVAAVGLLWEVLAVARSPDPLRGLRVLPMHVAGLAVYCFAVSVQLSRRDVVAACRLLALSALILLGFSVASFLTAGGFEEAVSTRAIESAVGRSNALATLFGMAGVLCLGLWTSAPELRLTASVGVVASAVGLTLTGSRGGLVATVVGLLVLLFWLGGRGVRLKSILALSLASALAFGFHRLGVTAPLEERFQGLESSASPEAGPVQNVLIRLDYWRVSWEMFRENPLLGEGLGSFADYYERAGTYTIDRPTDPHNQFFLLLGETGAIGAAAGTLLAAWMLSRAWPRRRQPEGRLARVLLVAPVVVAFTHSLVEPVFRNPSSVGFIALFLGLAANRGVCARLLPDRNRAPA